jgi:hypothetical protein
MPDEKDLRKTNKPDEPPGPVYELSDLLKRFQDVAASHIDDVRRLRDAVGISSDTSIILAHDTTEK